MAKTQVNKYLSSISIYAGLHVKLVRNRKRIIILVILMLANEKINSFPNEPLLCFENSHNKPIFYD
jgi:hypothetical protein